MNQRTYDPFINILKLAQLGRIRKWFNTGLYTVVVFLLAVLIAIPPAHAQNENVPVCDSLTLYGNAVQERLCKSISPATQNLWVCAITNTDPDIHTTFNANTNLHFTVRTPPAAPTCEGASYLTGKWNKEEQKLNFKPNEPKRVCGVNLETYLTRLNAVRPQDLCQKAFLNAQNAGIITATVANSYINQCKAQNCPN